MIEERLIELLEQVVEGKTDKYTLNELRYILNDLRRGLITLTYRSKEEKMNEKEKGLIKEIEEGQFRLELFFCPKCGELKPERKKVSTCKKCAVEGGTEK